MGQQVGGISTGLNGTKINLTRIVRAIRREEVGPGRRRHDMKLITKEIEGYRDIKIALWNNFYRSKVTSIFDCGALDDFESIEIILLRTLMDSFKLTQENVEKTGVAVVVIPRSPSKKLSGLLAKQESGYRSWDEFSEMSFDEPVYFDDVFEFDRYGDVRYEYCLCNSIKTSGEKYLIKIEDVDFFVVSSG